MIRVEGVSHWISGHPRSRPVLEKIDFTLERGETVALMGANGSGKSTLARCLNGLLVPQKGAVTVDGLSTSSAASSTEIKRRVGMLFQDPSQQLVTWSVEDEIAFGPRNLEFSQEAIESAVESGLARWGLEDLRHRRPHDLSGGQMTAVAVASVMAVRPSYMLVDEPSSLLDRRGRAVLRAALAEIRREADVGLLWITQFAEEAMLCDRLVVLSGGRIVADGDPSTILLRRGDLNRWGLEATPAALLSHELRCLGVPLAREHVLLQPLMEEFQGVECGATEVEATAGDTSSVEGSAGTAPVALGIEGVSFGYANGADVLEDVSFKVHRGECLGIAGASGSGKTTLAFLAAGAIEPASGAVIRGPGGPGGSGIGAGVGLATQFPEEQFCVSTVFAEVELGLLGSGLGRAQARGRAERLLRLVGLDPPEIGHRSPLAVSEGEKRKVALASALAREGSLLVLDEPTLGLDGPSSDSLIVAIGDHLRGGGSALIASHSGDLLFRASGGLLVLVEGRGTGPLGWNEAILRSYSGLELPEGQLPELAGWLGGRPPEASLGSFDALVRLFAERVVKALGRARSS